MGKEPKINTQVPMIIDHDHAKMDFVGPAGLKNFKEINKLPRFYFEF